MASIVKKSTKSILSHPALYFISIVLFVFGDLRFNVFSFLTSEVLKQDSEA